MPSSAAAARSRAKGREGIDSDGAADPGYRVHVSSGKEREGEGGGESKWSIEERWNLVLLVVLYTVQAVPMGLAMGAIPFMLQSKLSYTQMGIFSLAAYPYSMKLLWSPIVDCIYHPAIGRRKTWIIPIQLTTSLLFLTCATWVHDWMEAGDVVRLTSFFLLLVLLSATQDIAVDGWALTLLEEEHVGYAASCQTLGGNLGFFSSFTIFLALNNPQFCDAYIRPHAPLRTLLGLAPPPHPAGVVSLERYIQFWGVLLLLITLGLALLKAERVGSDGGVTGPGRGRFQELCEAYKQLWRVVKLPAVLQLSFMLVTYRIAVLPAESAASLKLMDKGVSKESLAFLVLLQFPVELGSALLAGRWAAVYSPFPPFMLGYCLRLVMALSLTTLVSHFPLNAASISDHWLHFGTLSAIGLTTSFVSTLMFTCLGSFFNTISDPQMGGAYLTLLNTIANMGIVLPKTPMFWLIDKWTVARCEGPGGAPLPHECPKKLNAALGDNACTSSGGTCTFVSDGFYLASYACIVSGLFLALLFARVFSRLIKLPQEKWRAPGAVAKATQHVQ